jgi:hypothetical protein
MYIFFYSFPLGKYHFFFFRVRKEFLYVVFCTVMFDATVCIILKLIEKKNVRAKINLLIFIRPLPLHEKQFKN